jgi:hypothetical protein
MGKRVKMHWVIRYNADPDFVKFELNGEINCLIPKSNAEVLSEKYLEILSTVEDHNFDCIIVR